MAKDKDNYLNFIRLRQFFDKLKATFLTKEDIDQFVVKGKDGVSISSVVQTATSTVDGGTNIVTVELSDGTNSTFNVKNGSKGSPGQKGDAGENGISIINVEQTTTSAADNGINVITITLSDGSNETFYIKNGSKGTPGVKGDTGQKGIDGTSATWFSGTEITGTSITAIPSPVSGSKAGDMYLNTNTYNVYRANAANSWIYVCNIKGDKGDSGTTGKAASISIGNVTTANAGENASVINRGTANAAILDFVIPKGDTGDTGAKGDTGAAGAKGATGTRGSMIFWGTAITGTSTTATVFSGSGISSALVNDLYINTSNWNIYQCTTAGAASTAKWTYKGNIKGAKGAAGTNATTTAVATVSANGLMGKDMVARLNLCTSELVQKAEPTTQKTGDSWLQEYT